MSSTQIIFDQQAKDKLLKGINVMADAVASTLGPRGCNVAIARSVPTGEIYERIVLHDGVSVARSIQLADEFENMGAQLLKEASQKQVDKVGDGTTVTMILARAIITECLKMIATGINPMSLRLDLEEGTKKIVSNLEKLAVPLKTDEDMIHIAQVSAENDELGDLVAQTLKKVGAEGVIDIEESKRPETTVEYQEGMQFDKGYIHQLFVTNPERMEAVFENPCILVTDKTISSLVPFGEMLKSYTTGVVRPLVIISPDITGEALPLLVQNKLQGKLMSLCIKAPSFGADQKNILQDIAILTGAKYITEDAGHRFEDITIEDLGEADFVTSTKNDTIISGGQGSKELIKKRIASIKKEMEGDYSEFDIERMKSRLGKLTNGIAVISVGGMTEIEMKERRERVIDAVAALRAAMRSGIVAGGETVYLTVRDSIKDNVILYKALEQPFKKLVENAGYDGGQILEKLNTKTLTREYRSKLGFDVTDGNIKNMIDSGIVDPIEVSIEAIKNAVSVAIQIMSINTIIIPESKEVVKK
jgi:chaperonin GroEL